MRNVAQRAAKTMRPWIGDPPIGVGPNIEAESDIARYFTVIRCVERAVNILRIAEWADHIARTRSLSRRQIRRPSFDEIGELAG